MNKTFVAAALLCCSVAPSTGWAGDWYSERPNWGIRVSAGALRPHIGATATTEQYTEVVFGKPGKTVLTSGPWLKELALHRYILRYHGLLGVYGSVGHWRIRGKTRVCQQDGAVVNCSPDTIVDLGSSAGNGSTMLSLLPLSVGVIYNDDMLVRRFAIPLALQIRGGLDYNLWWVNSNDATAFTSTGKRARGATLGYSVAGGVAFNLDWVEPDAARKGRNATGVTDTYLAVELLHKRALDPHTRRIDPGGTALYFGLLVDFL